MSPFVCYLVIYKNLISGLYSLGSTPIKVDNVKIALRNYPDTSKALELLHGLEHGFILHYCGPRMPIDYHCKEIVGEMAEIAREKINHEISLGRIAGPFTTPPFPTLRTSPIFVVPKKSSSEFRLIQNLSFPFNESVNDYIDRDFCSVKYSNIDDAVNMIQRLGTNALLAKCDIKSAFRILRLAPSEFDLTGFKFDNQYYFNKNLIMGASVSCSIFESFSTVLHWYVEQKSNNENILHYLDDFLLGGPADSLQCKNTLTIFEDCCSFWGVPLAEGKTIQPTEILIFLGIEFNTKLMIMRLPKEKITSLRDKLRTCLNLTKITLRELQSLIGALNFACQVIAPGRAFCRRLIDATCNLHKPQHKTRVTLAMKDDIKIWLLFLDKYNGTTVFLDRFWVYNDQLQLFSDSAGGTEKPLKGFGIYFNGKWAQANWPESWLFLGLLTDITFLELFPVVVAINIWGPLLRNKKILFRIDNQSVVNIINKSSSKNPRVMSLVRKLVLACLEYNILLKCSHIPGCLNTICDSLSRSNFQKFRRLCPTADTQPTLIPSHLWQL